VPEALDAGERFDLVTAFDVVEHIADDVAALRMFRRVLAPGGRLVLTVPAFPVLWSQHDDYSGHHRRYRRAGLARALHAAGGFQVDRITYFNTLLFPPALVARVAERVLRPQREERSDPYLAVPARPVNDLLCRIFAAERGLLRRRDLPFGVSLAAACRAV
jgi:SAM-dependent methyltransferase